MSRIKNGVKNAATAVSNSRVGKATKWTAKQIARNQNTIGKTIKTGARLTGTILGAGIGAAVGIASGDISKVGQNIAIGATAGNSIGTGVSNTVGKGILSVEDTYKNAKERGDRKKYGENYSNHIKQQKIDELMKDRETKRYFENARSSELVDANGNKLKGKERKEKVQKMMDQYKQYMEVTGVTDKEMVAKAMNLDKNNPTSGESMAALMLAKDAKDVKGMEAKQKELAKTVGEPKAQEIANKAAEIKGFYK